MGTEQKTPGYRELTDDEQRFVREARDLGAIFEEFLERVNDHLTDVAGERSENHRWAAIGRTHMQEGLMAVVRAVTRPEWF